MNTKTKILLLIFLFITSALTSVFIYFKFGNNDSKTITVIPTPDKMKILSFNINHGEDLSGGYGLKEIIEIITREQPDFVTLNDIDNKAVRTYREDQARKIAGNLGMYYTFGKIEEVEGGWNGQAILSKYPILYSGNRFFKNSLENEKQTFLHGIFQVGDLKINIFTTELSKDESIAELQNQEMLNRIVDHMTKRAVNDPIIITGSFNLENNNSSIKEINNYFVNTTKDKLPKEKLTYPANNPIKQMDYVFYRKNIKMISSKVIKDNDTRNSSDHLPIVTEFKLR